MSEQQSAKGLDLGPDEVLTTIKMLFWVVTSYRPSSRRQRFVETHCHHIQGWSGGGGKCILYTRQRKEKVGEIVQSVSRKEGTALSVPHIKHAPPSVQIHSLHLTLVLGPGPTDEIQTKCTIFWHTWWKSGLLLWDVCVEHCNWRCTYLTGCRVHFVVVEFKIMFPQCISYHTCPNKFHAS